MVPEDTTEVVFVGEDFILHREVRAGGIDKVDKWQIILEGDTLRTQHFFTGLGEEGPGLHRGIVGDNHAGTTLDDADARDRTRRGDIAHFGVHVVGGPEVQLQEEVVFIDKVLDALTRYKTTQFMLAVYTTLPAAFTDDGFLDFDIFGEGT